MEAKMDLRVLRRANAATIAALLMAGCFGGSDDDGEGASSIVATSAATHDQALKHHVGAARPGPNAPPAPLTSGSDPAALLGAARAIDNPYQPANRDANSPFPLIKLAGLSGPFPTGKTSSRS